MLKFIACIALMGTLCASQPLPSDEARLRHVSASQPLPSDEVRLPPVSASQPPSDEVRLRHVSASQNEARLRHVFQMNVGQLDTNKDGSITLAEFLPLWRSLHPKFGNREFHLLFSALDLDGDGAVSEEDFVTAASHPPPPEVVPLGFESADTDGDNHLTEAQAKQAASSLHLADADHVRYAIQHADHDGDGRFDLTEFMDATEELRRGGS